jgi:hypothetical protein
MFHIIVSLFWCDELYRAENCKIGGSLSGGYEHFYLTAYNIIQPDKIRPTFRRNMSPPSFGLKSKQER